MKTDRQLHQDITDELGYEPSLDEREVGIGTKDGVVTLTGRVRSYPEKLAAVRATERVTGVKAVANEIEVRPQGLFERSDVDIAEAAIKALAWQTLVPKDQVKTRVEKGWITLDGEVEWQYQKAAAEDAVRNLYGVRGITNFVSVKPKVQPTDVKEKITKAFERNAALHAAQITVGASESKVTLKGKVHSWAERSEAEEAAWAAPGVMKVENDLMVVP